VALTGYPTRRLRLVSAQEGGPRDQAHGLDDGVQSYQFGSFELVPAERLLLHDGRPTALRARTFDVLVALATRAGQLVTREQLLDWVWPGLVVEENNLSVQINALRKVLGSAFLATVPGRGYRFVGDVVVARRGTPSGTHHPNASAQQRPTHLPAEVSGLIGRDSDKAALEALMQRETLVSIVGSGGIGKTRLAQALLHAARDGFEHGVCFVELAQVQSSAAVPVAIAAALGLRLSSDGESEGDALLALARSAATLEVLVALDNAEHVLAGVAASAQALLSAAPRVRVLVTSQLRLGLSREWVYRLGPLAVADAKASPEEAIGSGAVALFVKRAQALDHRFALDASNVEMVIDLCRRLDGSALAIELAAARLSLLGLPRLVQTLDQRLGLLTHGARNAPARQQTLRAALEWSHSLLSPIEQLVFRRLAVFVGSASLSHVQRVMADSPGPVTALSTGGVSDGVSDWAALDALGSLVDRSLVSMADGRDDSEPRYRLLDSPLALAREHLLQSGELPSLRRQHAQHLLCVLEATHADLLAGRLRHDRMAETLAPDIDNGHAALDWALHDDPGLALRLAPLLSMAMGRHRYSEASRLWSKLEPLLDATAALPAHDAAIAALYCAEHWQSSRIQHTRTRAEQAVASARAAGLPEVAFMALKMVAGACWRAGDRRGMEAVVAEVAASEQPQWSAYIRSHGAGARAWQSLLSGDNPQAIHWFKQQAELHRLAGMHDGGAVCNIAGAQLSAGMPAEAEATSRVLVQQLAGSRDQHLLCFALSNLSAALLAQDLATAARAVLHDWWPTARLFDQYPQWADDAALVAALEQRPQAAIRMAAFADAAFAAMGQPREAVDQARVDKAVALARAQLRELGQEDLIGQLREEALSVQPDDLPQLAFSAA